MGFLSARRKAVEEEEKKKKKKSESFYTELLNAADLNEVSGGTHSISLLFTAGRGRIKNTQKNRKIQKEREREKKRDRI